MQARLRDRLCRRPGTGLVGHWAPLVRQQRIDYMIRLGCHEPVIKTPAVDAEAHYASARAGRERAAAHAHPSPRRRVHAHPPRQTRGHARGRGVGEVGRGGQPNAHRPRRPHVGDDDHEAEFPRRLQARRRGQNRRLHGPLGQHTRQERAVVGDHDGDGGGVATFPNAQWLAARAEITERRWL